MLILVSNPVAIENEADLINQFFDEGLQLFHLRKPNIHESEIENLMQGIHSKHYSKIAFHQSHHLAKSYGINRLHFTEKSRKYLAQAEIIDLKKKVTHLSTSVHSFKEFKNLPREFDYTFIGPVFNSISKKGYKAIDFKNEIQNDETRGPKLIAIGGITKYNIGELLILGFNGVAVLGSIWSSKNPVKEFIEIKNKCNNLEITY